MAPPSPWWGMGLKAPHATPLGCVPPSPEMAPLGSLEPGTS